MRILLLTSILVLTVYIFNSCSICSCKKVPCPAFEDVDFQTWFAAYQTSQRSIFKYQSSFDTITTAAPNRNEAYEENQGCIEAGSGGCLMSFSVGSDEIASNLRRKLSISYGGGPASSSISLFIMGFDCLAMDVNDQGIVLNPGSYTGSYTASLTLNGTSFNNVQVITRDTTFDHFTDQPYKVYLGKGTGLIAYEMFPGHQLWIKQ